MRDKLPPIGLNSDSCNLTATCSSDGTWLESPKVCNPWPIVPRYFLDPSWTTVAFVRDPWYRSLSMYHDQMHRGHLPKRWKFESQKNFSNFIVSYSNIRGHWSEGFKHTGDAVNYCGLRHVKYDVYVDVDQETFLMDPVDLESKISNKTKAILVVHMYGAVCDMENITKIANRFDIPII